VDFPSALLRWKSEGVHVRAWAGCWQSRVVGVAPCACIYVYVYVYVYICIHIYIYTCACVLYTRAVCTYIHGLGVVGLELRGGMSSVCI